MADENKKPEAPNPPPQPPQKPAAKEEGPSLLMREAMGRYGVKAEHVLASKEYNDHVVIVTKGGSKVSYAAGDEVKKLSKIQLDGVPPPKPAAE